MNSPLFNGFVTLMSAAHFGAGIVAGLLYFHGLSWNARLFAKDGRTAASIALMITRIGLLAGLLTCASLEGAMPLLMMALGVFVGRFVVMRRVRAVAA